MKNNSNKRNNLNNYIRKNGKLKNKKLILIVLLIIIFCILISIYIYSKDNKIIYLYSIYGEKMTIKRVNKIKRKINCEDGNFCIDGSCNQVCDKLSNKYVWYYKVCVGKSSMCVYPKYDDLTGLWITNSFSDSFSTNYFDNIYYVNEHDDFLNDYLIDVLKSKDILDNNNIKYSMKTHSFIIKSEKDISYYKKIINNILNEISYSWKNSSQNINLNFCVLNDKDYEKIKTHDITSNNCILGDDIEAVYKLTISNN